MEEKLTWTPEKRRERMIAQRDACISRAKYWRHRGDGIIQGRLIMPEVGQTEEFMQAEAAKADRLALVFDGFANA